MAIASSNTFPQVILDAVTSAPTAPTNDNWKLYATASGVYARSSNTTVGPLGYGTGGILGEAFLQHASVDTTMTLFGTSSTDIDATNLAATFTVPTSGEVVVTVSAQVAQVSTTTSIYLGVREGSTTRKETLVMQVNTLACCTARWKMTGLTPGASLTYKAAIRKATSGTANVYHGPTYGAASITVEAAP